ncbi:hypothetical protein NL676_020444 [Syzygium grande]|nr:hypothetical protein NL676_020444 [Syzygium grande]
MQRNLPRAKDRRRGGGARRKAVREAGVAASVHDRVDAERAEEEDLSHESRPSRDCDRLVVDRDRFKVVELLFTRPFPSKPYKLNKSTRPTLCSAAKPRRRRQDLGRVAQPSSNAATNPTCLRSGRCALSPCRLNLCPARRYAAATCCLDSRPPIVSRRGIEAAILDMETLRLRSRPSR